MTKRCPSSILKGTGRLQGYRWQINERGVANIVESLDEYVEGLVYEIDPGHKRRLDRNEGVAKGFYHDEYLSIQLTRSEYENLKTGFVARSLETAVTQSQNIKQEPPLYRPAMSSSTEHYSFDKTVEVVNEDPGRRARICNNTPDIRQATLQDLDVQEQPIGTVDFFKCDSFQDSQRGLHRNCYRSSLRQ